MRVPEEECFVEIFADMEQLEPDHEPREWPDDAHSSNVWGILPPRSYFRFDHEAVESERQGLEALGIAFEREGSLMAALRTAAGSEARKGVAARTGEQFLAGLASGEREIWLNGEKITHPLEQSTLEAAARSMAGVFDLPHEHADEMLAASPDDGRLVNVTHLIPRSKEDLERRRRAIELTASFSGGTMGRTPDYLNVTFACFAGRSDVWARRGNERARKTSSPISGTCATRISPPHTLSSTRRSTAPSRRPSRRPARSLSIRSARPRTRSSCEAGRMLATLAPFADDLLIYPGSDIRPQDGRYALSFAVPIATPGLKFICRDSYSKQRPAYDYPLSSRFDEMDCVVIFDDVEVPKERVFLDGDTVGYSEVISETGWRGHIMHQAFTRAYVKLCFAFGLGHMIANTIGVVRFDHIQEKLGQIWNMWSSPGRPSLPPRRAPPSTRAGSGTRTTARSSPCAARCRSGCPARTSCSS